MRIRIQGESDWCDPKLIRSAARWYAHHLMGPKLSSKISLTIRFQPGMKKTGVYAECHALGKSIHPRQFLINLDQHARRRPTLTTLAHEMTHVKQFALRELTYAGKDQVMRWRGETVRDDLPYWDQPFEIEAHGREIGLYHMWTDSLKSPK